MTDKVIVTIRFVRQQQILFEEDLELSAHVPMDELKHAVLEALKKEKRDLFLTVNGIEILRKGTPDLPLADDETLASAGIWDGSILVIKEA